MIDPICNMEVEEDTAAGRFDYNGKTYLFCSPHCLEKFKEEPASYVGETEQPKAEERPASWGGDLYLSHGP